MDLPFVAVQILNEKTQGGMAGEREEGIKLNLNKLQNCVADM